MATIDAAFRPAVSKSAGQPANAYSRGPSADAQFTRDGQVHHPFQPGFGNLPYHIQQHMLQNTMQLHQLHQLHQLQQQQRQYPWGAQQPQPVAQQIIQYQMPHVLGRQQQQLPVQQHAQQHHRMGHERPIVQQQARYQQPHRRAPQQQLPPQQIQQQLQQPYRQQPYQQQMPVPAPLEYPGRGLSNVGSLSSALPHVPGQTQAQVQRQAVTQWVLQQQYLQQQQSQQRPVSGPFASTTTTQPMLNGIAAPASIRSEAVATNGIRQMFSANGVGALITPNFAEMSDGPSNGPKGLDIVTPSHDHMSRAYQLLTGANLPIVLGNGDRATVRALGATPLVPGQPANIDLQVIRDDGRFRRLHVALTSAAPTPVQAAAVPADPAQSRPQNRHVRFNPYVQTLTQHDPVRRWEPISG